MGWQRTLRTFFEGATGTRILRAPLPRGMSLQHDIASALPRLDVGTVFDIGANVGQSARRYREWFPRAALYCFEPAPSTFERLRTALDGDPNARCLKLALGARSGSAAMMVEPNSELSFVVGAAGTSAASAGATTEQVEMTTLDDICRERSIERIGFAKIDVEGGELDVLGGAAGLLRDGRIDLIQVEAGMNAGNTRHVPFETLNATLQAAGLRLFALYEQMHEWPAGEPHLRRVDAVFVSSAQIAAHRTPRPATHTAGIGDMHNPPRPLRR